MKPLVMSLMLLSGAALAEGAVVSEASLPKTFVTQARREIALARTASPQAFAGVASVRAQVATLDARKRGRLAPVTSYLASLGPAATWALVEALAFDGALEATLPRSAHVAWEAGLLEALGRLQDARVQPLLEVAVANEALEPEVVRSATEALGLLGNDRAVTTLLALASTPGAHRAAMLTGLGACRRLAVADFLGRALAGSIDDAERLRLVKALSRVGNAWALETPTGAPVKAEVPRLKATAAQALVKLFVRSQGNVRQQAADALLIVAAPETPMLLAQVRAVDPAGVDALGQRFAALPR